MKRTLALFMVVCMLFGCVMVSGMTVAAEDAAPAVSGVLDQDRLETATTVLAQLVVLQGYEDGTYGEANNITRAEFSALLSRALRGGNAEPVNAPAVSQFSDVPVSHWAAGDIDFLYQNGIVAGLGDGTFNPEANVTTEQVAKMMVCALGYGFMAEGAGYPDGYIRTASSQKLLKGVSLTVGQPAQRGLVFVMLYNSLTIPYLTPDGVKESGGMTYSSEGSLLTEVFELEKVKGEVQANDVTGISSAKMAVEAGKVMIDNVVYESLDEKAAGYLGYVVDAYVKVDEFDESRGVLYVVEPATDAASVTIPCVDIIDADVAGNGITIEAYVNDVEREFDVDADAKILVNGVAYTGILDDADLMPEFGSVTLISTDGSKTYDLVKVEDYTPMLIDQVKSSSKQIVGTAVVNGTLVTKTYSLDDEANKNLIVSITSEGEEVDFDSLYKDTVVYVRTNGDFIGVEIASGAIEEGQIDKVSTSTVYIDGTKYESVPGALAGFGLGDNVITYKTKEGVVFYAEKGAVVTNAQYGMLLDAGTDAPKLLEDQTLTFKILKQDGSVAYMDSAEKMKFNGVRIGEEGATITEILTTLEATAPIASFWTYNKLGNMQYNVPARKYEQVIKYSVNAEGEITTLYSAITRAEAPEDYEGLVVESGILGAVDGGRVLGTSFNVSKAVTFYLPPVYDQDSDFRVVTGTPRRSATDSVMVFDAEDGIAGAAITLNGEGTKNSTVASWSDKYIIFSHMQPTITTDENDEKVEVYEYFFYQNGRLTSKFSETLLPTLYVGDMCAFETFRSNGYISFVHHKEQISLAVTNIANNTFGAITSYGTYDYGYESEGGLGIVTKVDNGTMSITYDPTGVSGSSGYVVSNVMGDCVKYDCETGYIEPCSTSEAGEGDVVLVQANRGNYASMIIFTNTDKAGSTPIQTENELD